MGWDLEEGDGWDWGWVYGFGCYFRGCYGSI